MSVLGFECEWFDPISNLVQTMFLKYFMDNNTVEIIGTNKKAFLKRIYIPELKLDDFFVGNTITIHNRLYLIKAAANTATTEFLAKCEVRFLTVIRAKGLSHAGALLRCGKANHLVTGRIGMVSESIFAEGISADAGDCIVEMVGKADANAEKFIGEANALGPLYETNRMTVGNISAALRACRGMRPGGDVSLCLVKPHIVKAQNVGEVLSSIAESGFTVRGIMTIHMTMAVAEEFFDIYRGVFLSYNSMVEHLCVAPCIAIMVEGGTTHRSCTVEEFRECCGPQNPALAKTLRPDSLRAVYGTDIIHNAVHCTDLPDDGITECQYFFQTMASM